MTEQHLVWPPSGPQDVPSESRAWAAAAQLLPLIGLWIIGPLIVWFIKRDEDPFVEEHAREAINFHLSLLVYSIFAGILVLLLIGIILLLALLVYGLVFMIIAGVKAATGERYRYPIIIRFVGEPYPTS